MEQTLSHVSDVLLFFLRQVIVQRVHVDGLCRTKDDLLTQEISGIFRAKNLMEVRWRGSARRRCCC